MSKILKNQTASIVDINDTGQEVPASGQLTINPQDYLLYAASDDVITLIGAGTLVVNDGSVDLSIADGTKLIQGIFPNPVGLSGPTGTQIGNEKNRLLTNSTLEGTDGGKVSVTNFSELRTVERNIDVEVKFYYNINTITILSNHANGGSASVVDRQALLETGTASNGKAFLRSKDTVDYRVSQAIEASCTFVFPDVTGTPGSQTGPANARMLVGLMDENEQDYIRAGFDDGSEFFVEYGRDGVNTRINRADFSRDKLDGVTVTTTAEFGAEVSEYTPDWTKLQVIRIIYSWHGVTPFIFQIQKENGDWRTFHTETFINRATVSSIGIPILPVAALVENTGKTTNTAFAWQAGQISFLGNRNTQASIRNFERRVEDSNTANQEPLLTIRNKTTYQGLTNFITAKLNWLSCSSDGNRFTSFTFYRNATLTGASFSDIDTVNSVFEFDTSASSFSGTDEIITVSVGEIGQFNGNLIDLDLEIFPGESVTVVANTGGSVSTTLALRWGENH